MENQSISCLILWWSCKQKGARLRRPCSWHSVAPLVTARGCIVICPRSAYYATPFSWQLHVHVPKKLRQGYHSSTKCTSLLHMCTNTSWSAKLALWRAHLRQPWYTKIMVSYLTCTMSLHFCYTVYLYTCVIDSFLACCRFLILDLQGRQINHLWWPLM